MWTVDNFFIADFETGINISDSDTDPVANEHVDNDEITFTNVTFENVTSQTNYLGVNTDFFTEANTTGAGNGADVPSWANGWTRFN